MTRSATSSRWADLRLRVLSAVVLAPITLGCIAYGGLAFGALMTVAAIGLAYEWLGLCRRRTEPAAIALYAALPLSVLLTAFGTPLAALALLAAATATAAAAAAAMLSRGHGPAWPLLSGIPYLGAGALALVWLRLPPTSGAANVIVLLLIVWASDIGAYLAGRAIGGPRLAPAISPGKTWSGAVGGLVAAALTGLAAAAWFTHGGLSLRAAAFAVVIGIISQAGDLFESWLKRQFGVKDSGALIPGHGGLLDRVDAVLTAAPASCGLALILGHGVVIWQ